MRNNRARRSVISLLHGFKKVDEEEFLSGDETTSRFRRLSGRIKVDLTL